jgi:hypothetical protein
MRVFGPHYSRVPNEEKTTSIMAQNEARGYPQMIERIDCMLWKNFPFARQVLNKGHHGEWCVVVLEGVEYYDMWIWHALFLA